MQYISAHSAKPLTDCYFSLFFFFFRAFLFFFSVFSHYVWETWSWEFRVGWLFSTRLHKYEYEYSTHRRLNCPFILSTLLRIEGYSPRCRRLYKRASGVIIRCFIISQAIPFLSVVLEFHRHVLLYIDCKIMIWSRCNVTNSYLDESSVVLDRVRVVLDKIWNEVHTIICFGSMVLSLVCFWESFKIKQVLLVPHWIGKELFSVYIWTLFHDGLCGLETRGCSRHTSPLRPSEENWVTGSGKP